MLTTVESNVLQSESFTQVIKDLLGFQFSVMLIVWLALFAPMTCQYHGYLMRMMSDDAMSMRHSGGNHVATHSMPLSMTMIMSFLVVDIPSDRVGLAPTDHEYFSAADELTPDQIALPVPEQPPRSL